MRNRITYDKLEKFFGVLKSHFKKVNAWFEASPLVKCKPFMSIESRHVGGAFGKSSHSEVATAKSSEQIIDVILMRNL